LTLKLGYTYLSKVQSISNKECFDIRDTAFTDTVELAIALEPENAPHIKSLLADISAGTCELTSETIQLVKTPL